MKTISQAVSEYIKSKPSHVRYYFANKKYKIGKRRNGDVGECYANVNKANKILNWKSKLSIEDSLLSAWNWEKKINSSNIPIIF